MFSGEYYFIFEDFKKCMNSFKSIH